MSFPRYPTYKDSGVEWLGEVPGHWGIKRLKHNLRLLTEKTDRRDYPVALENIEGWTGRFIPTETEFMGEGIAFDAGDILFGKLRPYLAKAYRAEFSGEAVGDFYVMRPATGIDSGFAQYQILNREFIAIVDGSTFGSKMPRASWEFVGGVKVTTPPLDEQSKITAFLDRETAKIDALVAEQRRLMALLKEKRQAVISHAVTQGLNPDAPLKPSGIEWLGDVPAHWAVKKIKFVTASVKAGPFGSALTKDVYVSTGYRVYGQEQVIPNDFTVGDYFITPEKYNELSQYSVSPGDILISCVGTFGKIAIVPDNIQPGIINPRLIRLRCSHAIKAEYLVEVMRSNVTFEQFASFTRGGTMDVINISTLNEIFIALPPMAEQQELLSFIQHEIAKFDTLTTEAQRAIDLLQERRTALISAAVTGQIDVRKFA